jgi:hypothetical protein
VTETKVRLRPAAVGGTFYRVDQCDNDWGMILEYLGDETTTQPPFVRTKRYVLDFTSGDVTLCDRCVKILREGLPQPTLDEILSTVDEVRLPTRH